MGFFLLVCESEKLLIFRILFQFIFIPIMVPILVPITDKLMKAAEESKSRFFRNLNRHSSMPEHVAKHGDADPLCEPLPARLEGPALRGHGEEEGQADAAQGEGVVPGLQEGLVVVWDGEAFHGLAEEDGEEWRAHAEHDGGQQTQEVVADLRFAQLRESQEQPPPGKCSTVPFRISICV